MHCTFVIDGDKMRCSACGYAIKSTYKNVRRQCRRNLGLGDMVKAGLSAIGITEERVSKVIGRPCGCSKRAEALNALGRKIGIG